MFGLAGYISNKKDSLSEMLEKTSPYSEGNIYDYKSGDLAIGIKQLSRRFDDTRVCYDSAKGLGVAFSGRIYNKAEIADASCDDAEALLLGYKKQGKDIVKSLKGMFAFALYDEENNELIIARDGCGIRPMYYYFSGGDFVFASNTRAFEAFDGFKKELNEKVLSAFLCFGSVPTCETFIKGVYRLEPGHIISFKDGKITNECFFKLQFNSKDKPFEEFVEDIHKTAVKSIGEHAFGNFATFLSGGVDSSYIASVARPKTAYTAGYSESKYDESVFTKELADILGIENKVRIVTPEEYLNEYANIVYCMDEPLANPSVAPIYFGAHEAAKDADIIISGEGADELFGGYNSYNEEIRYGGYMKLPYFIRHFIYIATSLIPSKKVDFFARRGQRLKDYHIGLGRILNDKDSVKLVKSKCQISTKSVTEKYYEEYKDCSTMKQRQAIDYYFWLINDFVHCVARSAEHFGIESRFPLLCRDIIDVAVKLPDGYKLKGGMTKAAFRMAAKKAIPNDAYGRKKLGFPVPLKEWIKRNDFYGDIKAKFESDTAKRFFDAKRIMKLLDKHKSGKSDNYKIIWALYTFIVWYELNFKD